MVLVACVILFGLVNSLEMERDVNAVPVLEFLELKSIVV